MESMQNCSILNFTKRAREAFRLLKHVLFAKQLKKIIFCTERSQVCTV